MPFSPLGGGTSDASRNAGFGLVRNIMVPLLVNVTVPPVVVAASCVA